MQRTPEEIERIKQEKRLTKRFHKACADYQLIEEGDHILIGLSGGKDSLALVELLGKRQKIYVPRFQVTAVHVSMEGVGYQSDLDYLQAFCTEHDVPFVHKQATIKPFSEQPQEALVQRGRKKEKNQCFLCSWYRRKALFETASELGCNKIALGHHKDDIVETFLLNLIFQGNTSAITPKMQMDKFPMVLIRPLCLIPEEDLQHYAQLVGYQKQEKNCPFEHDSSRAEIKKLMVTLKELNPNVLHSIWGAVNNI